MSLDVHSLTDTTLHTCIADTELVLEKFAYAADTSVSEVVDVVNSSDALAEVEEVAYCCENIVKDDVLGNEFVCTLLDIFFKLVGVSGTFHDFLENLVGNLLIDSVLFSIEINVALDVYHAVSDNLGDLFNHTDCILAAVVNVVFLCLDLYECTVNACLLDFASLVVGDDFSLISHNFACIGVDDRLCEEVSRKT